MGETYQLSCVVNGLYADDGSSVEITLATNKGNISFRAAPEDMLQMVGQLSEIATHAIGLRGKASGVVVPKATIVTRALAQASINEPVVALILTGSSGFPQHFALEPELSAVLRAEMQSAEDQAQKNRTKTIQ